MQGVRQIAVSHDTTEWLVHFFLRRFNEPWLHKRCEFVVQLSEYQLLKKGFDLWCQFVSFVSFLVRLFVVPDSS